MKKKYSILIIFIVFTQLLAQVKVTRNTPSNFSFTWKLDTFDTTSVQHQNQPFTDLSFKGANITIGEDGDPAIPGYSVFLGIPPKGAISINFVAEEIKTIRLSHQLTSIHYLQGERRQSSMEFSSPWISEPILTQFRDCKAAQLVIRPFLYDKESNMVRVVTKGSCTVIFPPYPHNITSSGLSSDYDRMLNKLLLNFQTARGWSQLREMSKRAVESYPFGQSQKKFTFKIGDGHSGINEATTNENGIMHIPGSRIIQLFGNVSTSKVILYASHKGELPESIAEIGSIPDGIIEVPLTRFDLNGNGLVDTDDYFLAYVTGASDYIWQGNYRFQVDRYDDFRNYILTVGSSNGKNAAIFTNATGDGDTLRSFVNRTTYKHPSESPGGSEGEPEWIWYKLSSRNQTFQYKLNLPGLDSAEQGSIKYTSRSFYGGQFSASLDETFCTNCISNGVYPITKWGKDLLQLRFSSSTDNYESAVELKEFEIQYNRRLSADSLVRMNVFSPSNSGIYHYKLSVLTDKLIYIFKISADEKNVWLVDTITNSAGENYVWSDSGNSGATYFVTSQSSLIPLPDLQAQSAVQNSANTIRDLRNTQNSTDYLIITHPDFLTEAANLALHKMKAGFSKPVVVQIQDIYRFFSGGDIDPTAVRNFITYVVRNWDTAGAKLDYVLLIGIGHFDFKNIKTNRPVFIPVYIDNRGMLIEDYFTYTKPPEYSTSINQPQLALGRFPVETAAEASAMVKKIIDLEDPDRADYGDWRNRAMFVADDDMQGDKIDPIVSMTPHTLSSDRTAEVLETQWPSIDLRKPYLYEYEWNNAKEKPEASRAILNEISNGLGVANYFGHGSETVWADEHVLMPEHIVSMNNAGRYPIMSSFSCSVGKFDMLREECLSALLVKADRAGAIATVSSSRLSYANSNERLAINFYSNLFDTLQSSAGIALVSAKASGYAESHRTYSLLGDPSIRMVKPIRKIEMVIRDSDKKQVDTISALQKVTVTGSVNNDNGSVDKMFGTSTKPAYIQIGLFNAADSAIRKDGGADMSVRYILPGTPVFLGKTQVRNGTFEQTVLIPRNVLFDKEGTKLTGYAWRENIEGAGLGFRKGIIFHGTEILDVDDSTGPRISIRPVYDTEQLIGSNASFTDRIVSLLPLKCEIELFDESGIDANGIGPDEGLTMELSGVLSKRNINNKFQFKEGDFRRGSASIVFEDNSVSPGTYTMIITARDLLGNFSKTSFLLEITAENELKMGHVFNFPNPMRMGKSTRFYFYPSNTAQLYNSYSVISAIKIYSLSGRVLRVIKNARNGEVWDGRDQVGNTLGPDIYLYQIIATSPGLQKTIKSKIKKLVIHPPR